MSSQAGTPAALDHCIILHAYIEGLIRQRDIHGTSPQQLEPARTAISKARNHFEVAIRSADTFVHAIKVAIHLRAMMFGLPGDRSEYSRHIPDNR
jgi:hypothetical protein